jgi:hypothetical protein
MVGSGLMRPVGLPRVCKAGSGGVLDMTNGILNQFAFRRGAKPRVPAVLTGLLLAAGSSPSGAEPLQVGRFSEQRLDAWQERKFSDATRYRLVRLDGTTVLSAESERSASGLVREIRIDLHRYPWLNWRWRIDKRLPDGDEKTRAGDDYAARLYVIASGGLLFWNTRAVNYVWSAQSDRGESWPNAFAGDNAMMLALRSGADDTATWYSEKRNVREDFKALHGTDIRYIDAVALMTDTDNGNGHAVSYYGDIYFTYE